MKGNYIKLWQGAYWTIDYPINTPEQRRAARERMRLTDTLEAKVYKWDCFLGDIETGQMFKW